MGDKLVSIIIPTYYRDEGLEESIESAISQTYKNTEIIVVDDSGEEFAKSTVKEYDVKYIVHEQNRGGNAARNTGYANAEGNYIQFLDDDDIIFPNKIQKQVELLESSNSVGVAYGGIVDRNNRSILPDNEKNRSSLELALEFVWPTTFTSSLLISDDYLKEIHRLKNRAAADDIGMKIELAKRTEFDYVYDTLTKIGDSTNSRSKSMDFVHELEYIFQEYQSEYDRFPSKVEKNALGNIYRTKASTLVSNQIWSPSATYYYTISLIHKQEFDPILLVSIFASLFGRPGIMFAKYIYKKYLKYSIVNINLRTVLHNY